MHMKRLLSLLLCLLAGITAASAQTTESYRLRAGDMVEIRMSRHDDMTLRGPIASDGTVELTFINTVKIAGLTRAEAGSKIRSLYADGWFKKPEITVNVTETRKAFIDIGGEVNNRGRYPFDPNTPITLLQAITTAGDFTTSANRTTVLLIRGGKTSKVNIRAIIEGKAADIRLQEGDTVRVQRSMF